MSVRMALAKLRACACGGAVIGGGAVHVAEAPARVAYSKQRMAKRVVRRQVALTVRGRRIVRTTTTTASCPPAVVTVSTQAPPAPLPMAETFVGGGGFASAVGSAASAAAGSVAVAAVRRARS